jgi:hypothetical protein
MASYQFDIKKNTYYCGQNTLVVNVTLMIFNCKASFRMVNLIF